MNNNAFAICSFCLAATACSGGEHIVGGTSQEATQTPAEEVDDGRPDSSELDDHGHEAPHTCPPIAGNSVHFQADELGNPVHWEENDCIAVTHAADALASAELVFESLKRLEALECLGLCFSAPVQGPPVDPEDRAAEGARIHVHLGPIDLDGHGPMLADVAFERKGGRIRAVDLLIDPNGMALTPNILLHEMAHSLGSSHSEDSNSALYSRYNRDEPTKELTEEDIEAFCAVYEGLAQTCE